MIGNKDIYNDDELYKYVEHKEQSYDYVLPDSKALYDINEHFDNIKKFEHVSPLKKMSIRTNKLQFESINESNGEEPPHVKPKRCPKGTKWDKKMQKCAPK